MPVASHTLSTRELEQALVVSDATGRAVRLHLFPQGRERGSAGERAHARRGPTDRSQHRQAARVAERQARRMIGLPAEIRVNARRGSCSPL
jgi:hypothetical protein